MEKFYDNKIPNKKNIIMGNLWKVTGKRESGKLVKGMGVEIPISDRSGKPRAKEIAEEILSKYNIEVGKMYGNLF